MQLLKNKVSARTLALAPLSGKSWIQPRHGIPIAQTLNPCFLIVHSIHPPKFKTPSWYGVMAPSLHPWSPRPTIYWRIQRDAGADPGFPVGGGANPSGGAPTYEFAKFREKLHEIEKILGRRGGGARAGRAPPKSATGMCTSLSVQFFSFLCSFRKKWPNNTLEIPFPWGWRLPSGKSWFHHRQWHR